MDRSDIQELHYIAHIDNVPSILNNGILSYERSKRIQHNSIADSIVQERRAMVVISGGGKLHSYANLYFNARNPMMYKKHGSYAELAVFLINPAILDEANVFIADHNAASDYVRFYLVDSGLAKLEKTLFLPDIGRILILADSIS